MEVSLGDYGRMMFEIMAGQAGGRGPHWESIRAEAEPLVRQLIALNDKMGRSKGTEPYAIVGVLNEGKKTLSASERIRLAQEKLWGVEAKDLKEGDRVWIDDGDIEMIVGEQEPVLVETVSKHHVYIDCYRHGTYKVAKQAHYQPKILRAPKDYDNLDDPLGVRYDTDEYWLEQADLLRI